MATTSSPAPLTWLITGCSSGFGLSLARTALAHGHHLIATSRDPSRTPDLVEEVTRQGGQWLALDASDADCGRVVSELEARGTAVDVLINSAGIAVSGPLEAFGEDEVRRVMDTNFYGPWRLARAVVPHMRRRRRGLVVNISSGAGMEPRNSLGIYAASKAALDVFTKALHKEMSEFGVRVLLVSLGTFNTPMASSVQKVAQALDADYVGTMTERICNALISGVFTIRGDHEKAVNAIYEVAVGEGVGNGREQEMLLPLGSDLAVALEQTRDRLGHAMEVFGDVCNNVSVEEKEVEGLKEGLR